MMLTPSCRHVKEIHASDIHIRIPTNAAYKHAHLFIGVFVCESKYDLVMLAMWSGLMLAMWSGLMLAMWSGLMLAMWSGLSFGTVRQGRERFAREAEDP
jgi:hypothetical protein